MNFKSFSQSLEQIFLTIGQNNFGNKIPLSISEKYEKSPHSSGLAALGNKKKVRKKQTHLDKCQISNFSSNRAKNPYESDTINDKKRGKGSVKKLGFKS